MKSPPKKSAAWETALETAEPLGAYRALPAMQVSPWWLETERLANEFRRTGQVRHLQALARHLDGVFERLTAGRSTR
jgi:hypothetical protein